MSAVLPIKAMTEAAATKPAGPPVRPLLRIDGLSKTFANGVTALSGIDLTIVPGEFVSLLGPSGCGKSTLLKLIAGLTAPTSGTIDWPQSMYDAGGKPERSLGFVFQEPTLLPWRTVADNVHLPLMLAGVSKRASADRVKEVLEQVGLSAFADSHPRQLSGGMKMRVSIARALVTQPKILLMDEPFAALDEQTRLLLGDKVLQIQEDLQQTTLLITHNITEAVQLSDRILVMTYRPGRTKRIVEIILPRPRSSEIVSSEAFGRYVAQIWADLREEATKGLREEEKQKLREGDKR
jgi:NitT/TauT family transport system ATP-binding protein